jgi:hypothetical protein
MFAAEFEPAEPATRRRSPRAPVLLHAGLRQGGLARTLCKVIDVSIHGARLQSYSLLLKGSTIWLTLPGMAAAVADVVWADDYVAGCQFHRPLAPSAFEELLKRQGAPAG